MNVFFFSEILKLGRNKLTGSIPPIFPSSLKILNLEDNLIASAIPTEIGYLTNIEAISIRNTGVGGTIPTEFGLLSNLGEHFPLFVVVVVNPFSQLRSYIKIYISETLKMVSVPIAGSLPSEIGKLTNLVELDIVVTQLEGRIPSEYGNLSKLEILALKYSSLTGTIPSTLGQLENLEKLFLVGNQLSGTVPKELGNLKRLGKKRNVVNLDVAGF